MRVACAFGGAQPPASRRRRPHRRAPSPPPPRYRWVPVAERSRSLALVYSGMFVGSILGLGLSPHLMASLGWPSVFYIFGALGVVWFGAWRGLAASTPREDPAISAEEKVRRLGGGGRGGAGAAGAIAAAPLPAAIRGGPCSRR